MACSSSYCTMCCILVLLQCQMSRGAVSRVEQFICLFKFILHHQVHTAPSGQCCNLVLLQCQMSHGAVSHVEQFIWRLPWTNNISSGLPFFGFSLFFTWDIFVTVFPHTFFTLVCFVYPTTVMKYSLFLLRGIYFYLYLFSASDNWSLHTMLVKKHPLPIHSHNTVLWCQQAKAKITTTTI